MCDHEHGHDHEHEHHHDHEHEHGHSHGHVHSAESKRAALNRTARIAGHLNSVQRMIEADADCSEVLIQLAAIRASVTSLGRQILKEHISTCIVEAVANDDLDRVKELNKALDSFLK